jgi:competence protein ComEC
MSDSYVPLETKFRAFQLESEGSLFSFYKKDTYTLIEARLPKGGIDELIEDMSYHKKEKIDVLHITSWDTDHCEFDDLTQIINHFRPALIEVPDYEPQSETGKLCKNVLMKYDDIHERYVHNVRVISQSYVRSLTTGTEKGTNDIVYESTYSSDCKNDMSLIRLFRSAGFNVLSLGDCESEEIARSLMTRLFITSEVDVLILPHHGAHNGFIFEEFLSKVSPHIAVCSSNFGNQYDHPRDEIRQMLFDADIPLYTTKTGDVIIYQKEGDTTATTLNMKADNGAISSQITFTPKRFA